MKHTDKLEDRQKNKQINIAHMHNYHFINKLNANQLQPADIL